MLSEKEKALVPALLKMREQGLSLFEAVKRLRKECGLALSDAQRVAAQSGLWEEEQKQSERLTALFLDELERHEP